MVKYLLRLDDACPTLDKKNWDCIEDILDRWGIMPMVGIIPNNKDASLQVDTYDNHFWEKVKKWEKKGWSIAMHGNDHHFCSNRGGVNPIHNFSEFAGINLEEQKRKIREGINCFYSVGIKVRYFFAPAHTFDLNTIEALKSESNIRIVSDTMAFYPYKKYEMMFIPCQFGHFRNIIMPGIWTFCYHPNMMNHNTISIFNNFLEKHHKRFISFEELDFNNTKNMKLKDRLYQVLYFSYRKIKKIFN